MNELGTNLTSAHTCNKKERRDIITMLASAIVEEIEAEEALARVPCNKKTKRDNRS